RLCAATYAPALKGLVRRMKAHVVSTLALGLVALAGVARAQGFALDRFEPSERGSEWFANESLDLRGNLRPSAGVIVDYAYRPLVVYNPDGTVRTSVVRDQLFGHLGGAVNLWDRVRLAVSIPVAVYQFGHDGDANGVTLPAPASEDVGDIRLGLDARILGEYGDAFTLAVGVQTYIPSGRKESYTGDETLRVGPRALAAGEYGPLVYAAQAGFQYRPNDDTFAGSGLGSQIFFGAAAGLKVADKRLIFGPEIYGSTVVT